MNNEELLLVLKKAFIKYLETSARSNEKLKILHSAFSLDLYSRLQNNHYTIHSLGWKDGKEKTISGRYNDKAVDITIERFGKPIAGLAVKFVMSNYSQNSNNYFENMLGETANIRSASIPYFQIFIIPDKIPYYDKKGNIEKWEEISQHNLEKYVKLSMDNIDMFMHTPNKTFVCVIHIFPDNANLKTRDEYVNYYLSHEVKVKLSNNKYLFGNTVIYNNYELFIEKVVYQILAI